MSEQDFIASKIKEGFTKQQATLMAKMSFAKQNYAQQGSVIREELPATKRDSLNLQKNYVRKENQLRALGYKKQNEEFGSYPEAHSLMFKNYQDVRSKEQNNIPTQVIQPQGYRKPEIYPSSIYREDNVNNNPYLYKSQEAENIGVLNPQVPYSFYDKRIAPTKKDLWVNDEYNDGIVNYGYDFGEEYAPKPVKKTTMSTIKKPIKNNSVSFTKPVDRMHSMQLGGSQPYGSYYEQMMATGQPPYYNSGLGDESAMYIQGDLNLDGAVNGKDNIDKFGQPITTPNTSADKENNERINILNPYGGVNLEDALHYGFQGIGEGNKYKAGFGFGLSALKGIRTGLSGYSNGRENSRVTNEYNRKTFETPRNYTFEQQGGEITNADILAKKAIIDQGQGATNLEGGEYVQNPQGEIQPVYGSRHIENGKIAEGVNADLENGSRVLSDAKGLITLSAKDAKELKERYNISVKKGDTPAQAQKKFDAKIGLTKEQGILADYAKKMEKGLAVKDLKTKEINLEFLQRGIAKTNEKISTLSELSKEVFNDLFERQEDKPKKGNGSQLFDTNGREVTEKKEGVMQQGGNYMYNLATQYGISPERAEQLLQMGGETDEQESQQENRTEPQIAQALQQGAKPEELVQQLSQQMSPEQAQQIVQDVMTNMQGESAQQQNQSPDPTQIIQAYAQITQQNPQEVVQQLQQMQPEQQQQALQQMLGAVQEAQGQQDQGQDGEQNPTQEANVMQNGGKVYAQQAKIDPRYTFFTPGAYDLTPEKQLEQDYLHQHFVPNLNGEASGGINPMERVLYQNGQVPYLMKDSGMYDGNAVDLKNTGKFQQEWANYRDSVEKAVASNRYLSADQKKNYLEKLKQEKFNLSYNRDKNKDKNANGFDGIYGLETSEKGGFNLPLITEEDRRKYPTLNLLGDVLDNNGKIKTEYKELDPNTIKELEETYKNTGKNGRDIGLGVVQQVKKAPEGAPITETGAKKVEYRDLTRNVMAQIPNDLRLPPSALQPLAKEYVPYGRLDPLKATPEAILAEQERQRLTDVNRVQQSGLSAGQQEAIMAQGLASSQMAAGDAIAKVQDYNNNNQYQTDVFNNQQHTKEAISNAQFNEDYQNKTLGSLAATERDWRNYYNEGNLQNRADYNSIENANLLNADSDKYQYIPGQGVKFIGGKSEDLSHPGISDEQWKGMTIEERLRYKKNKIEEIKKHAQMGGIKKAYLSL
jgi:hypothetical protein